MDEALQCPICFEPYDYSLHRPLLLPSCGHTFCKSCLHAGHLTACPEDRSSISDWSTLPTNILALRTLESQVERIPGAAADVKLIRSGDVQLLEKIGQGQSGEVWTANYRNKKVAVKIFDISLQSSSKPSTATATTGGSSCSSAGSTSSIRADPLMTAFMKEVELLQLVSEDSMYCCRLIGCSVKDKKPCIVMKWFGSGHLQVPEGGYGLASALQWGLSIAKALADVHALGIIVADLKPENVLISDQGDPVLADFGISRKLLTGQPPWLGLNMFQVMGMVAMQRAAPKLPSGLPCWLSALLQGCFAYEPSARPSAAQLVNTLKANTCLLAEHEPEIANKLAATHINQSPISAATSAGASGTHRGCSSASPAVGIAESTTAADGVRVQISRILQQAKGRAYMDKSAAAWVAQLRSTVFKVQAAAVSALHNEAQFADSKGGSVKLGELIDCIVSAGGIEALTGLLRAACTAMRAVKPGLQLSTLQLSTVRHVLVLLTMLLQTRPQRRAELAATGVSSVLLLMVGHSDSAAAALAQNALKLLSKSLEMV